MLTQEDPAMTIDHLIAYHTGQARYSATVRTPAQLRARILRRARQQRLTAAWGLRTTTGRRSAS
jgi:hypothetical protein